MKKDPRFNSIACSTTQNKHNNVNYVELFKRILTDQPFTRGELFNAKRAAYDWQVCSCGNLCELIPRDDDQMPDDLKLREMGCTFPNHLENAVSALHREDHKMVKYHIQRALTIHLKIEKRATTILNEMFTDEEWINYLNKHNHEDKSKT